MNEEELKVEIEKCRNDLRYFYNTYWTVNGKPVKPVSEEEWSASLHIWNFKRSMSLAIRNLILEKNRSGI